MIHTYCETVSIKRNIKYKALFDLFNTTDNQVFPTDWTFYSSGNISLISLLSRISYCVTLFILYHLLSSKKAQKLRLFTKSLLKSKIHHRCINNALWWFLKWITVKNNVYRAPETQMGDFKSKGIYRLFVVVVQMGFPVVFQPTRQIIFILLPRQPVNTKPNFVGHRKVFFSIPTKQTDMTSSQSAQKSCRFFLFGVMRINSIGCHQKC